MRDIPEMVAEQKKLQKKLNCMQMTVNPQWTLSTAPFKYLEHS